MLYAMTWSPCVCTVCGDGFATGDEFKLPRIQSSVRAGSEVMKFNTGSAEHRHERDIEQDRENGRRKIYLGAQGTNERERIDHAVVHPPEIYKREIGDGKIHQGSGVLEL